MIFTKILAEKIMSGDKTVTRRTSDMWASIGKRIEAGATITRSIQPGRFAKSIGRVRIKRITKEEYPGESIKDRRHPDSQPYCDKHDLHYEAMKEGLESWGEFCAVYMRLNGAEALLKPCYRIEFEVIREALLEAVK